MKTTLLKRARLEFLRSTAAALSVQGDYVELGVWRGGSAATFMSGLKDPVDCWLFDSFEGMPEPTEHDTTSRKHASEYANLGMPDDDADTLSICKRTLRRLDYPQKRIHVVQGWFEDTFPVHARRISDIAVLHVDCDWYESVKLSLETFYDKVVVGGTIIFDDYGCWNGARKAVDEFMEGLIDPPELSIVDGTGRYVIKRTMR